MKPADVKVAASGFDARRARRNIVAIWREARRQDTPAVRRAAECAARLLKQSGIDDVRIEEIPADGESRAGGWIMPVAWDLQSALLAVEGGKQPLVLADTKTCPLAVALYSPPTPGGQWVSGKVVTIDGDDEAARLAAARKMKTGMAGRFLLLRQGTPDFTLNVYAASQGCLGILSVHPGPARDVAQYLNYAVPLDAARPCLPVFALTRRSGDRLLAALDPDLLLRARVRARRYAGYAPLVTGSVGEGGPAVYLCGHIDEIGAQDNASGCGAAIEALRVLRSLGATQKRQIRFYFSSEVRGLQWWFNNREKPTGFLGGLNLDMVAADPSESNLMQVLGGFKHRPHFAELCLHMAVRAANAAGRRMPVKIRFNYVSDAVPRLHAPGGHVSLEQKPGAAYHTSGDTPRILSDDTLSWSGAVAVAFLYAMTRMDNVDVLGFASTLRRRWEAVRKTPSEDPRRTPVRLATQAASLRFAFRSANLYPDATTPEALYVAGVNRSTGLWPETAQRAKLESLLNGFTAKEGPECANSPEGSDPSPLVPVALFNGFLSFEDHVTGREAAGLARKLGLKPGWGTESWAWILPSCFTGKHTLDQILGTLHGLGIVIEPEKARQLTLYLVERGLARLRPVLTPFALARALRRIGVRRGSILAVHASLSRFGYVEGGPDAVIAALRRELGPSGTLAMPTHSNSVLGAPPYHPATAPSSAGIVTERFRRMPGVLRSAHPTHSVAAVGPRAEELVACHRVDMAPLARDGFWGKLYDLNGDVLLLCPVRSATLFHAGETWLSLPQKPLIAHALDAGGKRRVHVLPNAPWHVDHFEKHLAEPLIRRGIMKVVRLGDADLYCAPARAMADISVARLKRDPSLCLGKGGRCRCHYCGFLRAGLGAGT